MLRYNFYNKIRRITFHWKISQKLPKTSMYFQVSLTNSAFTSILHMQPIISSASLERGEF